MRLPLGPRGSKAPELFALSNRQRGIDFSTYLGGSGADIIQDAVVDADGTIYVVGGTEALDFVVDGTGPRHKGTDAFVLHLAADGLQVLSSVIVGGSGDFDMAHSLVLAGDSLYVAGATNSADFPTTSDANQPHAPGAANGFVLKLAAEDLAVQYASFVGGSGTDAVTGVAVNAFGEVFLSGVTRSTDFLNVAFCRTDDDAFLVKLDSSCRQVDYAVCIGGSEADAAFGLSLDDHNRAAVVVGSTTSTDFPIMQPLQAEFGGAESDAFVAVLDQASGEVRFATYWGGSLDDRAGAVATDGSGVAYVVGVSDSSDFPITHDAGGDTPGELRGFIAKFLFAGDAISLGFSRVLGGAQPSLFGSFSDDVTVNAAGHPVVVGGTYSADFPVRSAHQTAHAGGQDGYVMVLDPAEGEIEFSTFLGGSRSDRPATVATRGDDIVVAGTTSSLDFPLVRPLQGRPYGGDAFVTRIVSDPVASTCVYMASGTTQTLTVLDAARRQATGVLGNEMFPLRVVAIAVAPNGAGVYLLDQGEATVALANPRTGALVSRFGTFTIPQDLFLSMDGARLFVTDEEGLAVFDTSNQELLATLPMSGATRSAVDGIGRAFVLHDNGSHVSIVDPSGPSIVQDFLLGPGSLAADIAVVSDGQLFLVVQSLQSRLVAHDSASGALLWHMPIGPGARRAVVSPDDRLAFVSHQFGTGAVTVVDLAEQRIVALFSFEAGVEDLAVTPDGASLYISTGAVGQVWVADIRSRQVIGRISVGRPAEQMAFGTSFDGCRPDILCTGDCNADREVNIGELITNVRISLGTIDRSACASLGKEQSVTIAYLVGAVRAFLDGCPTAAQSVTVMAPIAGFVQ